MPAVTPRSLPPWALVVLGGALGGSVRWLVSHSVPASTWPWATLSVNLIGALLLGVLSGLVLKRPADQRLNNAKLLFGTGFCGALTTFSTLIAEVVKLSETPEAGTLIAGVWLGAQLLAGVALAWLGLRWASRDTAPATSPGAGR